jgi:hypothetical protein
MGIAMIVVGVAFVVDAFGSKGFSYGIRHGYDRQPTHEWSTVGRVIWFIFGLALIWSDCAECSELHQSPGSRNETRSTSWFVITTEPTAGSRVQISRYSITGVEITSKNVYQKMTQKIRREADLQVPVEI